MRALVIAAGALLIAFLVWDTLETIVLPRGATANLRLTRWFYRATWGVWKRVTRLSNRRALLLGFYGPISLLLLLTVWAFGIILGFAMVHWGLDAPYHIPEQQSGFGTYLYYSGVTFFTLGYGDIVPRGAVVRGVAVIETGFGFGFMALVIGYLPVLYQAYSKREISISKMDARAGSPPSAVELLSRIGRCSSLDDLTATLNDWEHWAAELMESHISYPVLSYYRSQHEKQSWLSSMTAVLDTTALLMAGVKGAPAWQAQLTFAVARHAVVDLCLIMNTAPVPPETDRLDKARFEAVRALLAERGYEIPDPEDAYNRLAERRESYEPYVNALARRLEFTVPDWLPDAGAQDNWQSSAWENGTHF